MVTQVSTLLPTSYDSCIWGRWASWLSRNTCSTNEWNDINIWKNNENINSNNTLDFIHTYNTFYSSNNYITPCLDQYANNSIWGHDWNSYLDRYNISVIENLTEMTFQCVANLEDGNNCLGITDYLVPNCTNEVTFLITECAMNLLSGADCTSLLNGTTETQWGHDELCNIVYCGVSGYCDEHWYDQNNSTIITDYTGCESEDEVSKYTNTHMKRYKCDLIFI